MDGETIEEISTVDGMRYIKSVGPDGSVTISAERAYTTPHWTTNSRDFLDGTMGGWQTYRADLERIYDYENLAKKAGFLDEEELKVQVEKKKSYNKGEHIVACSNEGDLTPDRVLKTLSAVKGRLMMDLAPVQVKSIECIMTPTVRQNIVTASRKLKMYGKPRPIIASFDEFGKRLPDEIEIGNTSGITLKIVDPKDYGEYYFELKGIEFPRIDYSVDHYGDFVVPEDLPF